MDANYDALTFWWNAGLTICTIGLGVYAWFKARHLATQASIEKIDRRVVALEESVKHAPSKQDVDKVHQRITEQAETMHQMQGTMQQMNHTLQLINEHLLNKK